MALVFSQLSLVNCPAGIKASLSHSLEEFTLVLQWLKLTSSRHVGGNAMMSNSGVSCLATPISHLDHVKSDVLGLITTHVRDNHQPVKGLLSLHGKCLDHHLPDLGIGFARVIDSPASICKILAPITVMDHPRSEVSTPYSTK